MRLSWISILVDSVFQSPSHRGGSAAVLQRFRHRATLLVSIPFSSGRQRCQEGWCFSHKHNRPFQSPSHRGGSAAVSVSRISNTKRPIVSIPFSSGRQRCQGVLQAKQAAKTRFNPLLIGAAALPKSGTDCRARSGEFQSPSHRGGSAANAARSDHD